ncbi:MAG: tRNA-dihydrouridine synthase [Candidatus Paceibacterota bacterium]|jgi:dihydroorotate dehydrogenase
MILEPFYDPEKSYEENYEKGPFGAFADGKIENKGGGNASALEPKYDFLGFKVNSPFGIPAGPLINGKFIKAALDKGFDIVVYKTVRSEKYPCHPWPNVVPLKIYGDLTLEKMRNGVIVDKNSKEVPKLITNSFGVPSSEPEFWQKDLKNLLNNINSGQIIVGSFQGTKKEGQNTEEYINDYRITAKLLKDVGVKVIEVNLSCPNEGSNNLLCYDIERSVKVVEAIKEVIGEIPLIIKIAYFEDEEALRNLVQEIGNMVEGISAINTMPARVLDENGKQALPGEGRLTSGLCGSAIKWAGLDMVKRLKKLREKMRYKFTIIGVGGVTTADDFFEYRNAGADVVMSATGAMWNPYLAQEIKERLR